VLLFRPATEEFEIFFRDQDGPLDLTFLPQKNVFTEGGEASIVIGELAGVSVIGVGGIYEDEDFDEQYYGGLPFQDPDYDTFETAKSNDLDVPDIVYIDALDFGDVVIVAIEFSAPVAPPDAELTNSIGGYIDFDVRSGGILSHVEEYTDFGDTGIDVDYYVDLFEGTLVDVAANRAYPIEISYEDELVIFGIPKLAFDLTDAYMAMVVGNLAEPTDIAPNVDSIDFSLSDLAAAKIAAALAGQRLGRAADQPSRAMEVVRRAPWSKRRH
jgi:hypothetical protein